MTQEQKDLLLQDLCARLLYGVKVEVDQERLQNYDNFWNNIWYNWWNYRSKYIKNLGLIRDFCNRFFIFYRS